MRSYNFWRLMFNKVTSSYYGYFLKFSYFFWQRNGFLQVGQKLHKLVKKTEGILRVNKLFRDTLMIKLYKVASKPSTLIPFVEKNEL
jgi:hypothetical protein